MSKLVKKKYLKISKIKNKIIFFPKQSKKFDLFFFFLQKKKLFSN